MIPEAESEKLSLYGNFSQPIYKVSNASVPSILRLFFESLLTAPRSQVSNPLKI